LAWRYRALVPFALEQHGETDKLVYLEDANSVDPTVTTFAGHRNLLEAILAEQSLAETLKTGWGQAFENLQQICLVAGVTVSLAWLLTNSSVVVCISFLIRLLNLLLYLPVKRKRIKRFQVNLVAIFRERPYATLRGIDDASLDQIHPAPVNLIVDS